MHTYAVSWLKQEKYHITLRNGVTKGKKSIPASRTLPNFWRTEVLSKTTATDAEIETCQGQKQKPAWGYHFNRHWPWSQAVSAAFNDETMRNSPRNTFCSHLHPKQRVLPLCNWVLCWHPVALGQITSGPKYAVMDTSRVQPLKKPLLGRPCSSAQHPPTPSSTAHCPSA